MRRLLAIGAIATITMLTGCSADSPEVPPSASTTTEAAAFSDVETTNCTSDGAPVTLTKASLWSTDDGKTRTAELWWEGDLPDTYTATLNAVDGGKLTNAELFVESGKLVHYGVYSELEKRTIKPSMLPWTTPGNGRLPIPEAMAKYFNPSPLMSVAITLPDRTSTSCTFN
ncbi:hypothetical protein ACFPVT_07920 [Corynebacterium choanae]|uniref:Secreted protein n=1 Tax=Corynebacterium choanae TaxID=1862358 RepID=A0A3G6JBJ4_9CORY|nr:hypothetical protein [Corynebacterium choanae]AZA14040.1 hypothetical protein CCHOA_08245 [Corynebacterium choanae]